MLYYDRINLSEEIGVAESNSSKECTACHYCHNLLILCLNISDIVVITVKITPSFCFIFHDISKYNVIHIMENSVFDDRGYI